MAALPIIWVLVFIPPGNSHVQTYANADRPGCEANQRDQIRRQGYPLFSECISTPLYPAQKGKR